MRHLVAFVKAWALAALVVTLAFSIISLRTVVVWLKRSRIGRAIVARCAPAVLSVNSWLGRSIDWAAAAASNIQR